MKKQQPPHPQEQPDESFMHDIVRLGWNDGHSLTVGKTPNFVWFRNAKVATRTTLSTLDRAGVIYQMRQDFGIEYVPEKFADSYKFAFVRNPWDRLVSGWLNKVKRETKLKFVEFKGDGEDFEAFVSFIETQDLTRINIHFRLQTCLIPLDDLDFLGRFENFQSDLKEVLTRLDLDSGLELEKKNATRNRSSYQDYYTPALRDRVARLYQDDIKTLGYSF